MGTTKLIRRTAPPTAIAAGLLAAVWGAAGPEAASAATSPQTTSPSASPPLSLPTPPSADTLHAAQNLAAVSKLRDSLAQKYPDSFGGLFNNGDDTFTVGYVGSSSTELAAAVGTLDSQLMQSTSAGLPSISYLSVTSSISTLDAAKAKILADQTSLTQQGLPVVGAGIDESTNSVSVFLSSVPSDAVQRLSSLYPGVNIEVQTAPAAADKLDRYSDSAPWNGGDEMVATDGSYYYICTTGYGAHDPSGNQYMLSAGHCGNYKWYNTTAAAHNFSSGRYIGASQTVVNSTMDEQTLSATGGASDLVWTGTSTREYVANDANPVVGNHVCDEGAIGLESCGTVTSTNVTLYGVEDLFVNNGAHPFHGDSGGPMIWPTGYGYIAQGTIELEASPTSVAGEEIGPEEYTLGVRVNSLTSP